ncbi:MAG TPA: succinyl-diaminopimelate desuccinylase, partial [Xanthomonadales bacterium]|nr:succinyl-diaminopimelate desuccinylase [Xanthomonadales bacterium]
MSDVLDLTIDLCRRASVTPDDAGCQALVARRLAAAGFRIEHLRFGDVDNLWATHGDEGPVLAFLGHTDVVPTGPAEAWKSAPFEPAVRDGRLFARGAADMKGSVAAMVVALERFVREQPAHRGRIALLLTSDEEGVAIDGVRRVVELFRTRGERIDFCLVGEPSSKTHLGDVVRVGRRGSLNGTLVVRGVQGHVAFPDLALNPIHALAPALAELVAIEWDRGNAQFPPTRMQVSNIRSGTGATNVIPGTLELLFNFRFGTASRAEELMQRTEAVLVKHGLDYRIDWSLSGAPYLTQPGALIDAVRHAVRAHIGIDTRADTGGGTSDGRFVATLGTQVVELGPVNATIHQVDENVSVADLEKLPAI